ncbi:MAG: GNAT family N-acetyltransferase [Proteobacteria bacterium]|nr:GNAT family N-acetyltransferase [Pseudomonadota bacterium]
MLSQPRLKTARSKMSKSPSKPQNDPHKIKPKKTLAKITYKPKKVLTLTQNLPFFKTLINTTKYYTPSYLRNKFGDTRLYYFRGRTNKNNPNAYPILLTLNDVCVKVASPRERKIYYSIRSRVFGREFRGNVVKMKKDLDQWDAHSQVIVLINTTTGRLISGCRVIEADHQQGYYASHEFDISPLLAKPGKKLEISRFCIHPRHRKGIHFLLLWRGIFVYAHMHHINYLFGLPSIKTTHKDLAQRYYEHFQRLNYVGETLATPLARSLNFSTSQQPEPGFSNTKVLPMPDLYKIYIRSGAKICSTAGVDNDLKCIDFLIVLKMSELHPKYQKKS